ncbi:dTDP-4-dehydrorhamnose 3,5-epimerase [Bradyrhizobium barranii]|uniref:dTDP-4-dehydrorhamnose 3,5-epimerase n=1 Tax=Bradyrhizobium TaxID=374 RepID=UPI001FF81C36|nr:MULTISPECIES: dTDP-4-dehydrorhamnose 3,5-epimerase [Bradyrhizobium]MCK1321666.1 dTDP-4-dehydrorhamnose 3,5-epimerase [Bradyrhizobium sp. 156]MCK1635252.1 dTDP-4-dehydrorhamnose 3,5-epimerase [Bradyrhizobium sp. 162]WFT92836.1 dTDP-4-dehydrorhamnose 3,5-epimerase [Bradyrhizobium barranii]
MRFTELSLQGAYLVEIEPCKDERGFFARTFCEDEFAAAGLVTRFPQASVSYNARRGTVRGMHFQASPHEETKLVRCLAGAVYDVIVDLRPHSATYRRSVGVELSAQNRAALYIPKGFAHGFQSLQDDSELLYMIDVGYIADAAFGVRWNDPSIDVQWPDPIVVIADKDNAFPDWRP